MYRGLSLAPAYHSGEKGGCPFVSLSGTSDTSCEKVKAVECRKAVALRQLRRDSQGLAEPAVLKVDLDTYGHPWSPIVTYGHLWSPMVTYGHLWSPMVTYGLSSMVPSSIMVLCSVAPPVPLASGHRPIPLPPASDPPSRRTEMLPTLPILTYQPCLTL